MKTPFFFSSILLAIAFLGCSSSETKTTSTSHQTRFVPVADSVKLEALDWGSEGQPLIFLTGFGNSAHVFDEFAPKFTDQHHVYAITRRGFGQSSKPTTGYDMKTLAPDILVVFDSLHIDKALLVGHSIAGDEMSKFASLYSDRVEKMVYLDAAYDRTDLGTLLAKAPDYPNPTAKDSASVKNFTAYVTEVTGLPMPDEEMGETAVFSKEGKFLREVSPSFVYPATLSKLEHPDYVHIQCPALAIYAEPTTAKEAVPFYARLDSAGRKKASAFLPYFKMRGTRSKTGVT